MTNKDFYFKTRFFFFFSAGYSLTDDFTSLGKKILYQGTGEAGVHKKFPLQFVGVRVEL